MLHSPRAVNAASADSFHNSPLVNERQLAVNLGRSLDALGEGRALEALDQVQGLPGAVLDGPGRQRRILQQALQPQEVPDGSPPGAAHNTPDSSFRQAPPPLRWVRPFGPPASF